MTSSYWQQWISQPQKVWLRKAVFQFHLWSGIGIGLYVLMVSITGSILVYSNELYVAATGHRFALQVISKLLQLHDDLLGGTTGRSINGFGGLLVIVLALTGFVVWWPGIQTWRRSLSVRRNVGWRRFMWDLHSMIGFWTLAIIVLFGLSGAYLGNPQPVQDFADKLQPPTEANAGNRLVDGIIYWVAYLHFGRIQGIGIPCHGPGLCDQATKLTWAIAGLAPAAMVITGAIMWWNRVLRKRWLPTQNHRRDAEYAEKR
jgi:uncharacterized iron-regulated membrane protein